VGATSERRLTRVCTFEFIHLVLTFISLFCFFLYFLPLTPFSARVRTQGRYSGRVQ